MLLLVPYRVDVPLYRWPFANFAILALLVVCYIFQNSVNPEAVEPYVLTGWNLQGLVGHIFLHGGILHLAGNMIFLWVFGNAVCEKVGNIAYPILFLGLGIFAGMSHLILSGAPAIGASGAINGVVGMAFVWFPINEITMLYFVWFIVYIRYGLFELSSYWIVLLWLGFDILGAATGAGHVAYWAHIGGFATGVVLAVLLTSMNWVSIDETERTLLDVFRLRRFWRSGAAQSGPGSSAADVAPAMASPPRAYPLTDPDPPARPVRTAPEAMIPVLCTCGKILKVRREFAGRRGRCPACRAVIQIPEA